MVLGIYIPTLVQTILDNQSKSAINLKVRHILSKLYCQRLGIRHWKRMCEL